MSEADVSGSPETPQGAAEQPATTTAGAGAAGRRTPRPAPAADTAAPAEPVDDAPGATADTTGEPGAADAAPGGEAGDGTPRKRRRRGSRGGRNRSKPRPEGAPGGEAGDDAGATGETRENSGRDNGSRARSGAAAAPAGDGASPSGPGGGGSGRGRGRGRTRGAGSSPATAAGSSPATAAGSSPATAAGDRNPELPDPPGEGRVREADAAPDAAAPAAKGAKPKIGDTIPADVLRQIESRRSGDGNGDGGGDGGSEGDGEGRKRRRRRGGKGRSGRGGDGQGQTQSQPQGGQAQDKTQEKGQGGGRRRKAPKPVEAVISHEPTELDEETLASRRGRERKGRAVGRYSMCVHVTERATQIAVLEGRSLIEHYVSHPSDDVSQIHGNVYIGRVQNVLPGMEAAFVDIGTPKNAVLYRGDVHYDADDVERSSSGRPRIEEVLRAGQTILCQVTKNPIGAKGARLTQEVSLPGRFVVLIPNSSTYGISKRLPDDERKRLRAVLDRVKPAQHGVIVRTAAENVTTDEIEDDVRRLLDQWTQIDALAKRSKAPALLYREPDMAVRVIREEFSQDYRSVLIDDRALYTAVRDYVASISPELADRVEFYDPEVEPLPLYERHHVHEQLHRALDRKVWLPSGGSLIIEHTEALTVIDVNTGKNVGRSSLEETVFKNNLEAAVEVARQLRLRDVGGIIVVDFIDMERKDNREEVVRVFRDALSRDKTRTQVFEISELGLCEMTRKRIGEGLLESFTTRCPECEGRGMHIDQDLLPD
jgi:ribonuclease E